MAEIIIRSIGRSIGGGSCQRGGGIGLLTDKPIMNTVYAFFLSMITRSQFLLIFKSEPLLLNVG